MEIQYRREMKRNYLIMEPEYAGGPGYEARMLVNNSIEGLLRFHIKYMDEHQLYYYEITSMQPLGRLLESRFITREEICQLLIRLHAVLMRMEDYFLSEDGLLLEPEYIYVKPERFGIELCLVPGKTGDFPLQLSRLLQYLMKKVDHRDKECVVLAYGLYQESQKDNYGIEDLMKLVQKESQLKDNLAVQGEMQQEPEAAGSGRGDSAQRDFREPEGSYINQSPDQPCGRDPVQPGPGSAGTKKLLRLITGQMTLWCLVFLGGPVLIWLLKGPGLIQTYGKWGMGAAGIALAVIAVGDAIFYRMKGKGCARRQEAEEISPAFSVWDGGDSWGPEDSVWNEKPGSRWELPHQDQEPGEEKAQPYFQTTLLARTGSGGRRLEAGGPEAEDIEISYFPYIIGKQEDLVDYVLMRETVSRLHLRIDKEGEEYRVTDLNSTNGTQVGGRLLEANETVVIRPGETLCIADLVYTFK